MKKSKLPRNQKSRLKTAKGRKTSSQLWLNRQLSDPYVYAAKQDGYRSRAAYKLLEINQKYNFLLPNLVIIDLGAAPGSWSQVLGKKVDGGKVIAVDLNPMDSVNNVRFIQGDFTNQKVQESIIDLLEGEKVDIILSDMAPASTGHASTDHLRIINLAEEALLFAVNNLKNNGKFITKILKGSEEKQYVNMLKDHFKDVKYVKPSASRKDSREEFIYASGFNYRN